MDYEEFKNLAGGLQSIATIMSFIIGGIWVYRRYIRQQERYPNINFTADINVIGKQRGYWIVELLALIENKGKAQHKMEDFDFDVYGIREDDQVDDDEKFGGQVTFAHEIKKGTFLPKKWKYFFVDPGTSAKYSFLARIPEDISFVVLHSSFKYHDRNNSGHTAEKTIFLKETEAEKIDA